MLPLHLSVADQRLFNQSLMTNHSIRVRVSVMDLNHNTLYNLTSALLDGQVNVDASFAITRNCSLSVLDPDRTMQFDADNINDGALFMDRMIHVTYGINSDLLNRWIDVPVFTGPITKLSRDSDVVSIEAQGKEILSQRAAWRTATYKAGSYTVDVIKAMLVNTGETKFTLPARQGKLTKTLAVTRETNGWDVVQQYKGGYRAFYDARGIFTMRSPVNSSQFQFRHGTGGALKSYPQVSYETDSVRNTVLVKGGIPKGAKTAVEATAYAPSSHPFSAGTLGRNGYFRFLPEIVEDTNLTTKDACLARAKSLLNSLLLEGVDAQFDSLVIPHLEPWDVATVYTPELGLNFTVGKFSIPLVHSGSMSIGYARRVTPVNTRIRKRK